MPNQIDLNKLVEEQSYTATLAPPEHPDERAARLEREKEDARQQRHQNIVLFYVAVAAPSIVSLVCIGIIIAEAFRPSGADPGPLLQFATAILTAIVSGFIGYLTGRATA